MACTEIFRILHPNPVNASCKSISTHFPSCLCERESVRPGISPGVVDNNEHLARFVRDDPKYYDKETGEILPNNFELVQTRGLSTTRIEIAEAESIERQQREGKYIGYLKASVKSIRDIKYPEDSSRDDDVPAPSQVFAIYDTSLDENIFHADVCQSVFEDTETLPRKQRGSLNLKFRRALAESFGKNLFGQK